MLQRPIMVIDVESTGFQDDPEAHVIEVGAVVLNTLGEQVSTFESLVEPPVWTEHLSGAERIHGITRDIVESASCPHTIVGNDFVAWQEEMIDLLPELQWTAYGMGFDGPMMERTFGKGIIRPSPGKCIMESASIVLGRAGWVEQRRRRDGTKYYKWPKATKAMEFFRIIRPHIHRALPDALNEADILLGIVRHMRATQGKGECSCAVCSPPF